MSVDYNELVQLLIQDQLPSQHAGIIADLDEYLTKIKADALREAAEAWRKHLLTTDASYVCAESWLNVRAGWIEEGA